MRVRGMLVGHLTDENTAQLILTGSVNPDDNVAGVQTSRTSFHLEPS